MLRTTGIFASVVLIGSSMVVLGARPGPVFRTLGLFGMGLATALLVAFAGLGAMLLGALAFAYRPVRRLEDYLLDVIPDAVVVRDKDALQRRLDAQLAAAPGSR